ncbi:MAG: polysulfide reductase NrfD [Bacteroidia bacterium]|jgi:Ni/Fe-hydrogenase subunit HybB-like protein|nr:polysulfide reductase NrfD [Bacteroidia bacterium]
MYESPIREVLVTGGKTYTDVSNDICRPLENKPTKAWWFGFIISALVLGLWLGATTYTLMTGIGTWGLNKTVGWAFDITNFVFWVGIGHAGTLISAILLLFRQKWRMSINRSAEAMTIFAVICAASFIVSHMGRPWVAYWPIPLPNAFGSLWVNFNSPLVWDVFAISTYFSVSLVFWYLGLIPDIATIRDRATTKMRKFAYGFFAMGWNGSTKTWNRYELVSLILAGISTPLVLSVHTIVSMDFATSVIPGWHTTIFPPYFVAGAIFSGFGMVLTLLVIGRVVLKQEDYITMGHLDAMCKVVMLTGSMVGLAYITEFFIAWYSGVEYEQYAFINRATGPYAWAYWIMMSCNLIAPQVFWTKWARSTPWFIFLLSIIVNIGMWFERFVIIVTSLHRDYITSSWAMYTPTITEFSILLGSFGLFFTLYFLFCRYLPTINMAEIKAILPKNHDHHSNGHAAHSGAFVNEKGAIVNEK